MVLEDYKQLQKQKSRDSLEAEKMKMDKNAEWRNLQRRLKTEQTEAEMETLLAKVSLKMHPTNIISCLSLFRK